MALQAGLRRLHDFGPQIRRAISGNLEDEYGFFAEEDEEEEGEEEEENGTRRKLRSAEGSRRGMDKRSSTASPAIKTTVERDFLPLHRRNHSLFGSKWTQGKWAQAGGKKQSFSLPLIGLAAGSLAAAQTPVVSQRLDTLSTPDQQKTGGQTDASLR